MIADKLESEIAVSCHQYGWDTKLFIIGAKYKDDPHLLPAMGTVIVKRGLLDDLFGDRHFNEKIKKATDKAIKLLKEKKRDRDLAHNTCKVCQEYAKEILEK